MRRAVSDEISANLQARRGDQLRQRQPGLIEGCRVVGEQTHSQLAKGLR